MKKPVIIITVILLLGGRLFAQHPVPKPKSRQTKDLTDMVFFTDVLPQMDYSTNDIMPTAIPKQFVESVFKTKFEKYVPQSPIQLGVQLNM